VCTFPTVSDAVQCVVRVAQHAVPVARIELADEVQIDAINRHDETSFVVAPTLFLEFHGISEDDVAGQARETAAIASEHGAGGFQLMQAIKGALDPQGIFNPGKITT